MGSRPERALAGEARDEWVAQYFELLTQGYATAPLAPAQTSPQASSRRPKQSATCSTTGCDVPSRGWPFWMTSPSRLRTSRPSVTCAWSKSSKRVRGPFAQRAARRLFVTCAAIFRRCASKVMRCSTRAQLSLLGAPFRSPGLPGKYGELLRRLLFSVAVKIGWRHASTREDPHR